MEVYVHEGHSVGGIEVEVCQGFDPREAAELDHDTCVAQQDHVGEGKRNACEVRDHVEDGHEDLAQFSSFFIIGLGSQEGDDDAGQGGKEGDLQAVLQCFLVKEFRKDRGIILHRRAAGLIRDEAVHDDPAERNDLVHDRQDDKWHKSEQINVFFPLHECPLKIREEPCRP